MAVSYALVVNGVGSEPSPHGQFVRMKVLEWQDELTLLADVTTFQPHTTFADFISMVLSTNSLTSLKQHPARIICYNHMIRSKLIPSWTGRTLPSDLECELFALTAHLVKLGIPNLSCLSSAECHIGTARLTS